MRDRCSRCSHNFFQMQPLPLIHCKDLYNRPSFQSSLPQPVFEKIARPIASISPDFFQRRVKMKRSPNRALKSPHCTVFPKIPRILGCREGVMPMGLRRRGGASGVLFPGSALSRDHRRRGACILNHPCRRETRRRLVVGDVFTDDY